MSYRTQLTWRARVGRGGGHDCPRLAGGRTFRSLVLALVAAVAALGAVAMPASASQITETAIPTANSDPAGITTGPDGALWFTESVSNRVGRITTAGGGRWGAVVHRA